MKNSFIFYHKYNEHFNLLSDDELGKFLRAVMNYEINGIIPELEGMAKMLFSVVKSDLDENTKKYEETCERNKDNIRKRWNKENTKENDCIQSDTENTDGEDVIRIDTKNTTGKSGIPKIPSDTKNTDNDCDNEYENDLKEKNKQKSENDNSEEDPVTLQFDIEVRAKYPFASNWTKSLSKWKKMTKAQREHFLGFYPHWLSYTQSVKKNGFNYTKDAQYLLTVGGENWDVDWEMKAKEEASKSAYTARGQPKDSIYKTSMSKVSEPEKSPEEIEKSLEKWDKLGE